MLQEQKIWVGTGAEPVFLLPQMANRHGLIAGATGTGKTVTLKVLAEGFSDLGVPVFLSDVKGDLAGMVRPGEHSDKLSERLSQTGVQGFAYKGYPTVFWDVYGEAGHPIRTTVSEMGPLLLSRMLYLNEVQSGVLNILFRVADDEAMPLVDIRDLKAMLLYVGEHAGEYTLQYGNVSKASVGAIQRAIAILEDQGGDRFFGEPAFDIADWMQTDEEGRGSINVLAADRLFQKPAMYATFLLWLLSELYESLPEQGDSDLPRMVFFFDEAHLLFADCPRVMMEKVELVVRLIRSKGVGVYFITQNPADIPQSVLGQLGNRVQHALRAYTPLDQKAVKAAAQTFRTNPAFDTEEAITNLKIGEALLSFLDESGAPGVVEKAVILPPQSFMGAIDANLRKACIETSSFYHKYEEVIDRESAYEILLNTLQVGKTVYMPPADAPQMPQAPVQKASPKQQQGFMVYDAATGQYVKREIPTMAPVPQMSQPEEAAVPQESTISRYQPESPAAGTAREDRARQAYEKAEKERLTKERRDHADELREERAQRARRNDSILGRLKNSAISSVGRELGRTLTRGILGSFTRKLGG